ncbi:MAG TPA: ABC transporter permease subunit [Nakamurella sp.]|jgi:NitT/TauT family transport system permease protein|nr:ABC transporter permease subunit [Nakamurella sp.]
MTAVQASAPVRPPRRRTVRRWRGAVPVGSVVVAALAVLVWHICSGLTFVIPSPAATVRALVRDLGDPGYLQHLQYTLVGSFWAFVIAVAIGLALGLLLGGSRWASVIFEPLLVALNGVPKIVIYPILLPIFTLGLGSKIAMGALFALFPVMTNVTTGVRSIPAVYWKLARSVNCTRTQTLLHIVLPALRRPLLTGLRLAVSLALVGVVLGEFFATRFGLGRVVLQAYSVGNYADMMGSIILLIAISFVISLVLWAFERRVR